MKRELDRIKGDLQTIEQALGGPAVIGREWILWMKRDRWIGLWWSLPGVILIASAALPLDRATRYWGLLFDQWVGLLVCVVLLGLASCLTRKVAADDGRPAALLREAKRINGIS